MTAAALRSALAATLPGPRAQATMAPPGRSHLPAAPPGIRHASVLVPLFRILGEWRILFMQRTSPPGDRHGGQISFPGGSVDPGDRDAVHTALREAEEEVGMGSESVEVLGQLSELYIPVSNFLVRPVVGIWRPDLAGGTDVRGLLTLQVSEVARVLHLPLAAFLEPGARRVARRVTNEGLALPQVPFYGVEREEIWGATSMMLAELLAVVEALDPGAVEARK